MTVEAPSEPSPPPLTPVLPWIKCSNCRRTITLPPDWREFRTNLRETARIVLSVHQKRCTKRS